MFALPNYCHPYLEQILLVSLPLHSFPSNLVGTAVLSTDTHRTLMAVVRKVPPRLSIPALLQATPTIMMSGLVSVQHFGEILSEMWEQLDRSVILGHLPDICSITVLSFDLRRVMGVFSEELDNIENKLISAAVSMCVKLTETELKSFLLRLAEWKDASIAIDVNSSEKSVGNKKRSVADSKIHDDEQGGESARSNARVVCFYHFISSLCSTLQGIFMPTMGILWSNISEALKEVPTLVNQSLNKPTSNGMALVSKKSKKQKLSDLAEQEVKSRDVALDEAILRAKYILESVRLGCLHSSVGFIDEVCQSFC